MTTARKEAYIHTSYMYIVHPYHFSLKYHYAVGMYYNYVPSSNLLFCGYEVIMV